MIKPVMVVFALAIALVACDAIDSMQHGFEHSEAVAAELEKSLGVKPFVGFSWDNGSLTSVTVTFGGLPRDRSLPEILDLSRTAVVKSFKQEPQQIVVGFLVTK